jgi:hypothetical protein
MEKEFSKTTGFSLIISAILMIITMVLHPSGGSVEHILKIKGVLMGSHGLAIFSLPFVGFGFWGLSNVLQTKSQLSMLGFMMSCFGLVAGMIAATMNGLTLPLYVSNAPDALDPNTLKAILTYGRYINIPMDYIMIVMISCGIAIWSFLIVRTDLFPKWIGYFGLLLISFGILGIFLQFNFANLFGFRIFIFGMASWIIGIGYFMTFRINTMEK